MSSVKEYNKDTWDDLMKYVKRKARTKTDDKIAARLKKRESDDKPTEGDESGDDDEVCYWTIQYV